MPYNKKTASSRRGKPFGVVRGGKSPAPLVWWLFIAKRSGTNRRHPVDDSGTELSSRWAAHVRARLAKGLERVDCSRNRVSLAGFRTTFFPIIRRAAWMDIAWHAAADAAALRASPEYSSWLRPLCWLSAAHAAEKVGPGSPRTCVQVCALLKLPLLCRASTCRSASCGEDD